MSVEASRWAWMQKIKSGPKLVLLCLADHSDNEGRCWPGQAGVAEKCGMDRASVNRHVRNLEKMGLLIIHARADKLGHRTSNLYSLNLSKVANCNSGGNAVDNSVDKSGISIETGELPPELQKPTLEKPTLEFVDSQVAICNSGDKSGLRSTNKSLGAKFRKNLSCKLQQESIIIEPINETPEYARACEVEKQHKNLTSGNGAKAPNALDDSIHKKSTKANLTKAFSDWYAGYPKKVGRANAERAYLKLNPSAELQATMKTRLTAQIENKTQLEQTGGWMPDWPHPATWLNGRRWEDELQPIPVNGARHETHSQNRKLTDYDRAIEAERRYDERIKREQEREIIGERVDGQGNNPALEMDDASLWPEVDGIYARRDR